MNRRKLLILIERLAQRMQQAVPGTIFSELTVLLVGEASMRAINRATFNEDETTDVISLRYSTVPGEEGGTAEIVINLDLAAREGRRRSIRAGRRSRSPWGPAQELALYLAHGCDHLAGHDDGTPADRRRMRARELRWVHSLEAEGCLDDVWEANTDAL